MNIIVTGGAGFIGSHLCERLVIEGHSVTAIDDLSVGKLANLCKLEGNSKFKFEKIDLRDKEALVEFFLGTGADAVFHLAGFSRVEQGKEEEKEIFGRNVTATANLLEALNSSGAKELVFSSTSSVFGIKESQIHECEPHCPISFYAKTKSECENEIMKFAGRGENKCWILRLANVVGARQEKGVVYDTVMKLRHDNARLEVLGDGMQKKQYIHVTDAVDSMLYCWLNSREKINVFNISCKGTTTVKEIVGIVCSEMGLSPKIVYGECEKGSEFDVPNFCFDTARLEGLGWKGKLNSSEAVKLAAREIIHGRRMGQK